MKIVEANFNFNQKFTLESGISFAEIVQKYAIFGEMNPDKSNVSLIFHALTGSARADDWWQEIIGDGKALDTRKNAFICINFLGSRYGSTGANAFKLLGEKSKSEFPLITVSDIVRAQKMVLDSLGIERVNSVIGGSVGGMCALQFAADFPENTDKCVSIGATELSAMGLALNHLQREALKYEGHVGLARQIAMLSYKSPELFNARFARNPNRNGENPREDFHHRYDVAGYLDYQSEIFKNRFDVETFKVISKAMDLFELSDADIQKIVAETHFIGISSDWLFPAADVKNLCERFSANGAKASYIYFESPDGHDAFLSDTARMSEILRKIAAN